MAKTVGEKTKLKILETAESLFSENGFDGTSISMITQAAGVNKALVYYHFKDKNDIIEKLGRRIIEEVRRSLENSIQQALVQPNDVRAKIEEEIRSLIAKRKIISVMLMESLKKNSETNHFFEIANIFINAEIDARMGQSVILSPKERKKRRHIFVHEFFTGFIPAIAFVVFKDRLGEYFDFDQGELFEMFMDSLERSHIASHM